jgi:hypothetical protein
MGFPRWAASKAGTFSTGQSTSVPDRRVGSTSASASWQARGPSGSSPWIAPFTQKQGPAAEFRERLKGFGMSPTEDPEVLWNFEKFVLDRAGAVVARFSPDVPPDDPELNAVLDKALQTP